jgi:hypothetical protein
VVLVRKEEMERKKNVMKGRRRTKKERMKEEC